MEELAQIFFFYLQRHVPKVRITAAGTVPNPEAELMEGWLLPGASCSECTSEKTKGRLVVMSLLSSPLIGCV